MTTQQQHNMVVKTLFELEELGKHEEAKNLLLAFLESYNRQSIREEFQESLDTINYLMKEWHGK